MIVHQKDIMVHNSEINRARWSNHENETLAVKPPTQYHNIADIKILTKTYVHMLTVLSLDN